MIQPMDEPRKPQYRGARGGGPASLQFRLACLALEYAMNDAPSNDPRTVFETRLHSLPLLARGKVRDNYAVGEDRILMVASDRLSAFDVVLGEPIPGKGVLLTRMALFWFDKLAAIVPNHLTGDDPLDVVADDERAQVAGRSMLVKRLRPLPVEAVVRGYLAGSGLKEYEQSGSVCGVALPAGLKNASRLPEPIFTPATKAAIGDHDENIDFARMAEMVGEDRARQVRDISMQLYRTAAEFALAKGIVIADTKFEFGLDERDRLVLMDEVLTPDSSRFWPVEGYVEGATPPSYDKQFVRDWLEQARVDGAPWNKRAPAPPLPADVVAGTAARYREALQRLTA
jgi:phosphoribosylaminoimidazole-succinocarboxamide synthase